MERFRLTAKIVLIIFLITSIGIWAFRVYADEPKVEYKLLKVNIPRYFDPLQWNNNGQIYGLMGDKFIRYDPQKGDWTVLYPRAWTGQVNSTSKYLAFTNEAGLQLLNLEKPKDVEMIDANPNAQLHFWSPDGKTLLYSQQDEWFSKYYLYDVTTKNSREYTFKNVENYLSEPLSWRKLDGKDTILFKVGARKSRTGEEEYRSAGYRAELYRANLEGNLTPLVELKDGEYLIFDGVSSGDQKGYYHLFQQEDKIHEVDLITGQKEAEYLLPEIRDIYLDHQGKLAFVHRDQLQLIRFPSDQLIHQFRFEYQRVIWSADYSEALIIPCRESDVTSGFLLQFE